VRTHPGEKMTTFLNKITFLNLLLTNTLLIIVYMTIGSYLCDDGLSGGECVKEKDRILFPILLGLNLAFCVLFLLKGDKEKRWILLPNIVLMLVIFYVAAFMHSVFKAGLW
jgi:hypothetical protein